MKTICFTGHRPIKLHGYIREPYLPLVEKLTAWIIELHENNCAPTKFISGGAQGIDQLAFWAVSHAKKIYPEIINTVYVPFKDQERRWRTNGPFSQEDYHLMLSKADEVVYLQPELTDYGQIKKALFERNHRMVNDSDYVIGVYHGEDFRTAPNGGTAECLKYAIQQNKKITLIDPFTLQLSPVLPVKEAQITIPEFQGQYRFLSNFWNCPVTYNNITFLNAEAAYQAQKCPDRMLEFVNLSAFEAKKLSHKVALVSSWDNIKTQIMADIVYQKFLQNPELRDKLLATNDAYLVEGNNWKDTYWGICNGVGENWLGRILMIVRHALKQ